jgi:hypothetical protein
MHAHWIKTLYFHASKTHLLKKQTSVKILFVFKTPTQGKVDNSVRLVSTTS